jgi:hypothetical protein
MENPISMKVQDFQKRKGWKRNLCQAILRQIQLFQGRRKSERPVGNLILGEHEAFQSSSPVRRKSMIALQFASVQIGLSEPQRHCPRKAPNQRTGCMKPLERRRE